MGIIFLVCLILGFALSTYGLSLFSVGAALILAGLQFFGFAAFVRYGRRR